MDFPAAAELVGKIVDAVGVPAIVLGAVVATWSAVGRRRRGEPSYQPYRLRIGRSILLGLEFLAGPLPLRQGRRVVQAESNGAGRRARASAEEQREVRPPDCLE